MLGVVLDFGVCQQEVGATIGDCEIVLDALEPEEEFESGGGGVFVEVDGALDAVCRAEAVGAIGLDLECGSGGWLFEMGDQVLDFGDGGAVVFLLCDFQELFELFAGGLGVGVELFLELCLFGALSLVKIVDELLCFGRHFSDGMGAE